MSPSTDAAERRPPDKATLYCPDCGHESHINGDWIIQILPESLVYECPDCGAVIDSRRDRDDLTEGSGGSLQFAGRN